MSEAGKGVAGAVGLERPDRRRRKRAGVGGAGFEEEQARRAEGDDDGAGTLPGERAGGGLRRGVGGAGQGGGPARPSPGALRRHASVLRAAHGAPWGAKYTIYRYLRVRSSQYRISKGSEGAVRAHGHPQTQRTGHNLRKIGVAA